MKHINEIFINDELEFIHLYYFPENFITNNKAIQHFQI